MEPSEQRKNVTQQEGVTRTSVVNFCKSFMILDINLAVFADIHNSQNVSSA